MFQRSIHAFTESDERRIVAMIDILAAKLAECVSRDAEACRHSASGLNDLSSGNSVYENHVSPDTEEYRLQLGFLEEYRARWSRKSSAA